MFCYLLTQKAAEVQDQTLGWAQKPLDVLRFPCNIFLDYRRKKHSPENCEKSECQFFY